MFVICLPLTRYFLSVGVLLVGWCFFMLIFIALVDTGEKFVRKKVHSLSGRWLVPVPLAGTGACGKPKLLTSVPEEPGQPGPCDLTV